MSGTSKGDPNRANNTQYECGDGCPFKQEKNDGGSLKPATCRKLVTVSREEMVDGKTKLNSILIIV